MSTSVQTAQSAAWPEGVIARYLTVAGATVDIVDDETPWGDGITHSLHAACTGELCGWNDKPLSATYWFAADEKPADDDGYYHSVGSLQEQAQAHAEKCRALPRPTA